ncbi:MAG: type VI secretion system ATPase TssH, partial [Thermodesulfobacteriota bacterium]|nr:type VI secretion system ATPase TssH [Thermodesulfobacteriota bacterium]
IASIDLGEKTIRSGAILLAFLSKPTFFASGRYADLLKTIGREALTAQFWNITKHSMEEKTAAAVPGTGEAAEREGAAGASTALGRFCLDFTQRAREGKIDPVFGRNQEIRQMIDILARRRKNNPICVGEAGVGKTAVVEGLALRITEGDVPNILKDVTILNLDMGLLEAGAGVKGEFENRLKGVINEIKASEKPIILFIDEAHTLIGAGGSAGGGDAANLLKPALARGELRTVAATTWSEYKKYIEKDAALARRFQPVKLEEPSVETTTLILRGLKDNYEKAHNVVVRDDAVQAAAELSDRYITGRYLPDKAVDLLDTSCARVKINITTKPDVLEDKERSIQALEREKTAVERDQVNGIEIDEEELAEAIKKIATLTKEASELKERWLKEQEAANKVLELRIGIQELGDTKEDEKKKKSLKKDMKKADNALEKIQGDTPLIRIEVGPDVVAKVVSDWTGIPLGKVLRDQAQNILKFEDTLKESIKGQDHALSIIDEMIKASKSGLKDPVQPIGIFLLVGPSGVGKTETALTVADILFGGERSVVSINMSEFQEKHTVSRLIGSPPGYVGYGEGGMLTEAVRQKPYSVVILDEVEKAHLDVMNIFYQVFDKGVLSDGEGRVIDFKNTVIFLTSNLATDVITEMTKGDDTLPDDAIMSAVRPILSQHFKPALLARMAVVPFYTLRADAMKGIVRLKLDKLALRLMQSNKMKLIYTPAVVDQITARCTEVETGARNIDYILSGNIMPRMSQQILSHMTEEGMPSEVHLDLNKDGSFKMKFKTE